MTEVLPGVLGLVEELKISQSVSEQDLELVAQIAQATDTIKLDTQLTEERLVTPAATGSSGHGALPKTDDEMPLRIAELSIPEKIKLAMFGNMTARALLIRDPNRMIPQFVLKNPRLTLPEVEDFGRNANLNENVLRTIAGNHNWMKSYALKCNIVTNPKTPGDVALKWIRFLNIPELRKIAKSKNLPQVVAITARKKVAEAGESK